MRVQDVVEEIVEKLPENKIPVVSILRKLTNVRDMLLRTPTAAQQQSEVIEEAIDTVVGEGLYDLPCPPGNVTDVDIRRAIYDNSEGHDDSRDWHRIPLRQFNERMKHTYYYFVAGQIGIFPPPKYAKAYGIKIFYTPVYPEITVADLQSTTGFDPDWDMLLVYGVLRDIMPENNNFDVRYQQLLADYRTATSGYERYVIEERW
ncbi:hypothetical protein [Paenibacillus sp. S29]|uniref:phage adaptor protein n=1 Tax=Paenibacillus sp. S29 TaxID=3394611 RepID=UPI0039BEEE7A